MAGGKPALCEGQLMLMAFIAFDSFKSCSVAGESSDWTGWWFGFRSVGSVSSEWNTKP